jgi:hypothetical protein
MWCLGHPRRGVEEPIDCVGRGLGLLAPIILSWKMFVSTRLGASPFMFEVFQCSRVLYTINGNPEGVHRSGSRCVKTMCVKHVLHSLTMMPGAVKSPYIRPCSPRLSTYAALNSIGYRVRECWTHNFILLSYYYLYFESFSRHFRSPTFRPCFLFGSHGLHPLRVGIA